MVYVFNSYSTYQLRRKKVPTKHLTPELSPSCAYAFYFQTEEKIDIYSKIFLLLMYSNSRLNAIDMWLTPN